MGLQTHAVGQAGTGTGLLQGTHSKPVPMQQVQWVFSFSTFMSPVLYLPVPALRCMPQTFYLLIYLFYLGGCNALKKGELVEAAYYILVDVYYCLVPVNEQ